MYTPFTLTNFLEFDIDDSVYQEDTFIILRRAWLSIIGTVKVAHHPTPEVPFKPDSRMRLAPLMRGMKYWDQSEANADENWEKIVGWIDKQLIKLEDGVQAFNINRASRGEYTVPIQHFELELEPYVLAVKCYETGEFGNVYDLMKRFRELLNDGTLKGLDIERVEMPWIDPVALQEAYEAEQEAIRLAEEAEKAAAEAEAAAALAAEQAAAAAADAEEDEVFEPVEVEEGDEIFEAADAPEEEDEINDEDFWDDLEEDEYFNDDFDEEFNDEEVIDYTIWEVILKDGSSVLVDSVEGKIIEQ